MCNRFLIENRSEERSAVPIDLSMSIYLELKTRTVYKNIILEIKYTCNTIWSRAQKPRFGTMYVHS